MQWVAAKIIGRRFFAGLLLCMIACSVVATAGAESNALETPAATSSAGRPSLLRTFSFKDKDIDIFPVPVVQSRPDEKQSYGLMPVMLFSDKESHAIQTIIAASVQWNNVKKISGALIYYVFPDPNNNPDEIIQLYVEMAERYYRETTLRYYNPKFMDKFYIDASFSWLKTPFRRFFGYGADTLKAAETNYVSRNFYAQGMFGYYFHPKFRLSFTENFTTTDLLTRAINDVGDTLADFGAQAGVHDSTNLIHRLTATFDTRPQGINSRFGHLAEANVFFAHDALFLDNTFVGFSFEGIHMNSMFEDKTVTVIRAFVQDMYGTGIPFYLQSTLGGDRELRSYIPNRFTDTGKMIFTWEQRITALKKTLFGIPVMLSVDPFFEVGSVFNHFNNLKGAKFQPVAGMGLRFIVPPNVVARVDIAYGEEGYNVYTNLNYPF